MNTKIKVKICGIRRPEDVEMVNKYLPEYAGFIFADTPRKVSKETAAALREAMDPSIQTVGVFVNADPDYIEDLCSAGVIQLIQLHGDEEEAYIEDLRKRVTNPIVKAVRVQSTEQILEAEKLPVDYLLLDTYVKGVYGGSGKGFDKTLIPELQKPYFLAGGLGAENVQENIGLCAPYAVDVSSAVETDGVKDEVKIREFIEAVRSEN
jgi:phosphoribosylanthranilate isomerase